jgi:hypothetical protein
VIAVTPDSHRALPAEETAAEFAACGVPAAAAKTVPDGVRAAAALARREGRPLLCLGSLYLYAPVKQALEELSKE